MNSVWRILKWELVLAVRAGSGLGMAAAFFLIAVSAIPLGLGPDLALLGKVAPGILWVALLLSVLLTLERIFQADAEDGSLDLLMLAPVPVPLFVALKALAHWLTTGLPLALLAPFLGFLLNLDETAFATLVFSMLIGSPALSFLGVLGAGLTVGLQRGGLLISVLVLPFYVPTLIFGISAVSAVSGPVSGGDASASLMVLGAISLFSLVAGPVGGAAALRAVFR